MKGVPRIGIGAAALALIALPAWTATEIAWESVNAGGVSYAAAGSVQLGGTLGQNGFTSLGTGGAVRVQSGFWKLENGCELYPVALSSLLSATGSLSITFNAVRSNVYTVAAISSEEGGPPGGLHGWTNVIATLEGAGEVGSTTTIQASALANRARFFRVTCTDP